MVQEKKGKSSKKVSNKGKISKKSPKKGILSKLFGSGKKPVKVIGKKSQKKKVEKIAAKLRKEIHSKSESKPRKTKKKYELINTGISGFDKLFDTNTPGIPSGASILVEGGPGSGKTLFCLTTVANMCAKGKKCLYMSFEEPEERLIEHMESFGWPAKEWERKGLLRVRRFDALDVSRSIEALLSAAKKELLIEVDPVFFPDDFDPDFVTIDSLTSIASAFSGQESRFRIYMEQLFRYLEENRITNFLIREVSSPSHIGTTFKEQGEAVSFLSDGIIVIYNVIYDNGSRGSAIEILKMRGTSFKKKIVQLTINSKGGVNVNPSKVLKKSKKSGFNLT